MKVTLLLIGVLCVLLSAAQNKHPHLVLPKKKNILGKMLNESGRLQKEKPLPAFIKPPTMAQANPLQRNTSSQKPNGFTLPNGNIVMAEGLGQMPSIIPDMKEYPNFRGFHPYQYKGLGKIPNIHEM